MLQAALTTKEPPGESIRKIPGENNLFIFGDLQLYLRLRDLDSPAIISRQGLEDKVRLRLIFVDVL